jgi:hypothetical protein
MTTSLHELATCEQFQIEEYEAIAAEFVRKILGLNPEECFLSDESELDDFSLMGTTLDTGDMSWDEYIIARVRDEYGIELATTRINLVRLFTMIERSQNKTLN